MHPPRPVLIYIHGGGFVAGNKRNPASPFYDNIMLWAVKNGFVGVNATYRLARSAPWPAAAEDIAAWFSGSRTRSASAAAIPRASILMGHSAGAVHVASYVSHPEFHKVKGGGLAGAIMVSGIYELNAPLADGQRAYFGDDPARYAERSSLAGIGEDRDPADADRRRTGSAGIRAAIRTGEAGHLQADERMRAQLSCCRSTATCRKSMRSTPRIRG